VTFIRIKVSLNHGEENNESCSAKFKFSVAFACFGWSLAIFAELLLISKFIPIRLRRDLCATIAGFYRGAILSMPSGSSSFADRDNRRSPQGEENDGRSCGSERFRGNRRRVSKLARSVLAPVLRDRSPIPVTLSTTTDCRNAR